MHNQADSLQITKKQDETERNTKKNKKTAHIWKQSGHPFPHSHSQIGSVGSNFSPVIDMLRQQPPFLRQLEYFHRSIKLKWWDWNEKKKSSSLLYLVQSERRLSQSWCDKPQNFPARRSPLLNTYGKSRYTCITLLSLWENLERLTAFEAVVCKPE